MKKLIGRYLVFHLAASVLCGLCSSCRSTDYFGDRCRDAGDIVTTTIGKGAGAKVRIGPIHAGAFANRDCAGLRGGTLFSDWKTYEGMIQPHPAEFERTLFYGEATGPMGHDAQARGKTYEAGSRIPFFATVEDRQPLYMLWHYYTQVEVAAGLGGSLRIGFNAGELLDFVLGWFTLDVLHDDLSQKERLPHRFSLGGRSTSSGWYVYTLNGYYADPSFRSAILSAIVQPSVNPQGTRFMGARANSEVEIRIDCFGNGEPERDAKGQIRTRTITLQPGFHVYERRGNELIQAEFPVTAEQFLEFVNSVRPEHSIQELRRFLGERPDQRTSNRVAPTDP